MGAHRRYYRVISGTMRVKVWANGYRQAIKYARGYRNWRHLSPLTKFQSRSSGQKDWGPWYYVETERKV